MLRIGQSGQDITQWPSGDSRPVLATKLAMKVIAERVGLPVFREQDDLDWFTGLSMRDSSIGPILVMRHDGNALGLSAFYVDVGQEVDRAQREIAVIFSLTDNEIEWRLNTSGK